MNHRPLPCLQPVTLLPLLLLLVLPVGATAQNGPVPAQIASAYTVFLSNEGAESGFPLDPNQTFSQIYAALGGWGRYQLVSSPEQADLIFKLHDVASVSTYDGYHGRVYTSITPGYRVTVADPHTGVTLWTINSPFVLAGRGAEYAKWETLSVTNLVSRVKVLAGEGLTPGETADLTTVPKTHYGRTLTIAGVGFVAVAVGGGFLLHHFYEDSLASQKASQDAFCKANNIPLSECAGG